MDLLCTKCRETKPEEDFPQDKRNVLRLGRSSWCKTCYARKTGNWRQGVTATAPRYRKPKTKVCTVCGAPHMARGLCQKHYDVIKLAANRDHYLAAMSARQKANPARANATNAKRRAAKLAAMPYWAETEKITAMYQVARCYSDAEITCHVDHIVPLQGRTVCGLHVAANLQLLHGPENIGKGNRIWPDMP